MADAKKNVTRAGAKTIKENQLVARLVPNPAVAPDLVRLTGYLGRSARQGYWRLYQTMELTDYLEIAEDDIVHSESPEDESPTVVWVRREATIKRVHSESVQAQADFLRGDIAGDFLSKVGLTIAQGSVGMGAAGSRRCFTWGCCWRQRDSVAEADLRTQPDTIESDMIGLLLTEALSGEGVNIRTRGSHRCLTFGCCGGVSRTQCNLDKAL